MRTMPTLETDRLIIRSLKRDDLDAIHRILDIELSDADMGDGGAKALDARRAWLEWTVLNYDQLARLYQPPYGERAVALKASGELIGAVGYVPCLDRFGQLPYFQSRGAPAGHFSTEFGLFWAIAPAHQRKGYATEAAGAMIAHAFAELQLFRIVATTTYNNAASIGVMRKLGMSIERNPLDEPPWLQVVGALEVSAVAP